MSTNTMPIIYTVFSSAALLSANGAVHTGLISGNLLIVALKRWVLAYITWRTTRAVAQLRLLSDRQLEEIGLSRPDVSGAVRQARHRPFGDHSVKEALS